MNAKSIIIGVLFPVVAMAADPVDVNGTADLIAKLWRYNGQDVTLRLAAGDYNLPDAAMSTNNGSYGSGLSTLNVDKVKIIGMGAKPEDVKLIGAGNLRVIRCSNTPWFENLTITNGNATVDHSGENSGYYNRGGGVFGDCTLTNCVIAGCRARIGGGVQLSAKLYNCRVENNKATSVGGGTHNVTAYDTVYTGNEADSDGGGAYSTPLHGCTLTNNHSASSGGGAYNCAVIGGVIARNTASKGGGIAGCSAVTNLLLEGNRSSDVGGGAYSTVLTGCVVSNNVAGSSGGGAYSCNIYGGTVSYNVAVHGNGGGFSCPDNAACVVTGCVFYANCCSNSSASCYGGGMYGGSTAIASNCTFRGNWARKAGSSNPLGGGVARVVMYGGVVQDNVCDGYGGGVYSVTAKGVKIFRNRSPGDNSSNNSYYSYLDGCDISGGDVSGGTAAGSVFHDSGPALTLDNPLVAATVSPGYVFTRSVNATNCLICGNAPSQALFSGSSSVTASLVNCTVVSNSAEYTFIYFSTAAHPMLVENCLFYDNFFKNSTTLRRDISHHPNHVTSDALRFTHCAYLVSNITRETLRTSYSDDGEVYQFGEDLPMNPKFCHAKDAAHPYALRRTSPLRGIGAYASWMSSACDIRGEGFARADGASVDIGCYQCWLELAGTVLSIR